jgi:hypothetical protein
VNCPSCGKPSLTIRQKIGSSVAFPATCPECGVLAAAKPGWIAGFGIALASEIFFIGALIAAFILWSWWPLVAWLVFILVVPNLQYWRSPLVVVTEEQRARHRLFSLIFIVLLVVAVIIAGITDS